MTAWEDLMIKLMVLAKRKPGLTMEEFREHYETRHAPLARRLLPYMQGYVRNYVRHDVSHSPEGLEGSGTGPDFDVATEITIASQEDYERLMARLAEPEVQRAIAEDEERFVDRGATKMFFVETETSPG
jgi:uncharacterized protein (TIGR02118 family)